jgi:hypothetical protein
MILSGQVRDKISNELLPGVVVGLKNTSFGTSTDANGDFIIKNIPSGSYTLIVRLLGYQPIEKPIVLNEDLEFTIGINPTSFQFNPVEIVATKPKQKNQLLILGLIILALMVLKNK